MTFRLVNAGWSAEFESALSIDHSELRIVCPFIKARALDRLLPFRPENIRVETHGKIPRNEIVKLDWPDPPSRPAPPRDA